MRSLQNKVLSKRVAVAAVAALMMAGVGTDAVRAQSIDQFTRSYITPFPEGDQYRMVVFGDSLGDGIFSGLYRAFKQEANVEVVKKSRVSTGFVRTDRYNWNTQVGQILNREKVHIAVVMVGANDVQAIRFKRKWHKLGSDGWRELYGSRIDRFIKSLKGSNAAVYWVGLPIMRKTNFNTNMQVMNEIFREKAFLNGVKFVDTWNGFVDEFGRYSAYGPDLNGQVRKLRAPDGVHFTPRGYRKLAHFVERVIRNDLRQAKTERNIPLAGDESEQARAVRRNRPTAAPTATDGVDRQAKAPPAGTKTEASSETVQKKSGPAVSTAGRKVSKAISGVELVRPAFQDAARLEAAAAAYAPAGEMIALDIGNGLTALASVSPFSDPNLASIRQQLPLARRPYFRVLVRGERLRTKTGRADDFGGPKS